MRKTFCMLTPIIALSLALAPAQAATQIGGKEQRIQVQKGTWKGQLVDSACYKKLGAAALDTGNLPCTLEAIKKGGSASYIGLLTEGDGLFKIVGEMAKGNFAKLQEYVGKTVEMTGVSSLPIGGWATREIDATKIVAAR